MSDCVLHVLMGLAAVCVSRAEVAHPPHPDCGHVYLQGLDVNSFPTATSMEGLFMKLSRQSSEEVTLYQHESRDLVAGLFSNGTFLVIDSTGKRLLEGNATGEFEYYDPLLNQSVALSSTLPSSSPGTPESSHTTPQGLRLACADPSYHQCSTDRFQFTDVFYKIVGSRIVREAFSLAPRTRNGLPLYRTASGLELGMDLAAGWQVRDESGVLLESRSHASNPAYITSTWRERKGQGWQDAPGLRLACVPQLPSHNPPRNTCLNAAAASTHGPSLLCLCRHGYGGVNCSEKLPACPALPQLPGADGAYLLAPASPQPTHYPGDVLAVRCKDNTAPRPFVHVTCFRDAQGNVTWSNDVTCLVPSRVDTHFRGNSTASEVDVGFTIGVAAGSAVVGFLVALAIVLVIYLAVRYLRKRKSPSTDAHDEGQRREQSEQVSMLDTSQV